MRAYTAAVNRALIPGIYTVAVHPLASVAKGTRVADPGLPPPLASAKLMRKMRCACEQVRACLHSVSSACANRAGPGTRTPDVYRMRLKLKVYSPAAYS